MKDNYDLVYSRLNGCRNIVLQLPVNHRLRIRYRQCRQALANALQDGASGEFSNWAVQEAAVIADAAADALKLYPVIGYCSMCNVPIIDTGRGAHKCPCGGRIA